MNRNRLIFGLLALALSAGAVFAQTTPTDVKDLVGARAAGGETALTNRGYKFVKTTEGDDRKWSNWWHASKKVCLTVATVNGRYDSIVSGPSADCDQGMDESSGNTSLTPTDVADLVGARASSGETQLRNRGYRFVKSEKGEDRIWSNWWSRSKSVCLNVVTMNGRYNSIMSTPPSDCNQSGSNGGGSMPGLSKVDLSDLVGARAAGGETELQSRGFVLVRTMGLSALWQNRSTVQCVMVTTRNGRYSRIVNSNACPR